MAESSSPSKYFASSRSKRDPGDDARAKSVADECSLRSSGEPKMSNADARAGKRLPLRVHEAVEIEGIVGRRRTRDGAFHVKALACQTSHVMSPSIRATARRRHAVTLPDPSGLHKTGTWTRRIQ